METTEQENIDNALAKQREEITKLKAEQTEKVEKLKERIRFYLNNEELREQFLEDVKEIFSQKNSQNGAIGKLDEQSADNLVDVGSSPTSGSSSEEVCEKCGKLRKEHIKYLSGGLEYCNSYTDSLSHFVPKKAEEKE